jgi:uncharacterized protein YjdB
MRIHRSFRFHPFSKSATTLILLGLAACADPGTAPDPRQVVARVEISPVEFAISVGESLILEAKPVASDGVLLPGRPVVWASTDESVARVTAAGEVRAFAVGSATITATSEGRTAVSTVTVLPHVPRVSSVEILPDAPFLQLNPGGTLRLEAIARDSAGSVLSGLNTVWSSANPSVVSVDASGTVTAHGIGNVSIAATVGGVTERRLISVVSLIESITISGIRSFGVGDVVQLTATAHGAGGILNRAFTWTSGNPSIASVVAPGRVTGHAPGHTAITVSAEGKSTTVWVFVGTWTDRSLAAGNDTALPTILFTFEETNMITGLPQTVRFQATGGGLRTLDTGPRFEIVVSGLLLAEGLPATPATYRSEGSWYHDPWTGTYTFERTDGANLTYQGSSLPGGGVRMQWRAGPQMPEATVTFSAPR